MGPQPISQRMALVLHDADCGFCTRSAKAAQGPVFAARVRFSAAQVAALDGLGFTLADALRTMHMVLEDGTVVTGHESWAQILIRSRRPWPLVGRAMLLPGLSWLSARVYRWVAEHRTSLPGGTPSCSLADRPR